MQHLLLFNKRTFWEWYPEQQDSYFVHITSQEEEARKKILESCVNFSKISPLTM